MNSGTPIKLKVAIAEDGMALIQFLANRLAISRNKAKEIIDQRCVFVNGKRTWMARHNLQADDQVIAGRSQETIPHPRQPQIIYEDNDYLIVNKPAAIPSNGPNSLEQTLKLSLKIPALEACHRLDKDTTGCLIFAKNGRAKERIITLFAENQIQKKYEGIVRGHLPAKEITITKPIEGQRAVTHVRLLDSTPAASRVSISIETGRTHQIRIHMLSIGHPILGDTHHGVNRIVPDLEKSIRRQMLHASEISFRQPLTGVPVRCRTRLPPDMTKCLALYGLK